MRLFKQFDDVLKTQKIFIFLLVVLVMSTANLTLIKSLLTIYPLSFQNIPLLISLITFFSLLTTLIFLVISVGKIGKWLIVLMLMICTLSGYYLDSFGVLMDVVMIDNILHTNLNEAKGLINLTLILRILLLGVLPSWLVIQFWPFVSSLKQDIKIKLKWISFVTLLLVFTVAPFSATYASFIRQHKLTRYYAIPSYPVYSIFKFGYMQFNSASVNQFKHIAGDAKFIGPTSHHELIILVVGETARADHFSLNGYSRLTNPLLAKQQIVSFKNVSSCGTSTGVSVPCMFSSLGRAAYDKNDALAQENVLEVLKDHGVEVLWRDNNSDDKGVAKYVKYENFKTAKLNSDCDSECRDIGMLNGLEEFIGRNKNKDLMIVLHQMGNHGPEYFKRYPKTFESFKPACQTGELQSCNEQEINNAYDNAILYTDYFLSEVIEFLKEYDDEYETAMIYVSDHGESLGEHGIYLHAAPYIMAPKEQTHVPAIVWFGQHFDYDISLLKQYEQVALSHDDLFCSLLIAYELNTSLCQSKHKILMENLDIKHANKR